MRPVTLAGVAGVVVVGGLVPLVAVVAAGGGGARVGWVVLAGAAAAASGLALGRTRRVVPALALAVVAAAAVTVATTPDDDEGPVREVALADRAPVAPMPEPAPERSRGNVLAATDTRPRARRPTPERFVRAYYAELEAGRFEEAWSRLSAAAHAQSSFEAWRAGYATTVSQRLTDVRTEPGGVVRYVLVAVDRTPCGTTTERRFELRWRLVRSGAGFSATVLDGVKLAGVDPAAAC